MSKLTRVRPHHRAGRPVSGYTRIERKPGEAWLLPEVEDPWWEKDDDDPTPLPVKLLALLPIGITFLALLITLGDK